MSEIKTYSPKRRVLAIDPQAVCCKRFSHFGDCHYYAVTLTSGEMFLGWSGVSAWRKADEGLALQEQPA